VESTQEGRGGGGGRGHRERSCEEEG